MGKKKNNLSHNSNLEEIGIDEEAWYRIWWDLYHTNMHACNPQSKNVMLHYANIPEEYKMKFMEQDNSNTEEV